MNPLTEREIARFVWRVSRFQRYGLPAGDAEALADRLVARDQGRDDRRMCIECRFCSLDRSCQPARQGLMRGTARNFTPILHLLQRCEHFAFATPA